LAIVAHSYGGVIAVEYASSAATFKSPIPRTLMLAMPGCTGCELPTDLSSIAVGIADSDVGDASAQTLWAELTGIPSDHRS